MKILYSIFGFVFLMTNPVWAKVDLVTLPKREGVQLTIYNSADLTLAKEYRFLTLQQGFNELQFSWANTLIDPTSLEMFPKNENQDLDIYDLTFPARTRELGLWNIQSDSQGATPVEISYLTSGLTWRAFYLGTLSKDEKTMDLNGYVRITNNSGEDYENAQLRLIVGKVNLIDQVANLARQQYPYGQPTIGMFDKKEYESRRDMAHKLKGNMLRASSDALFAAETVAKQIVKEGLSEYFLYTIEGKENIPNGFSKRLPSFKTQSVPVVNLYKYEQEKYGPSVNRFVSFKNDKKHQLGDTPIPGGMIKVFRSVDQDNHLGYEGESNFKYIPVDEDVELSLGAVENVIVEPALMNLKTTKFKFDKYRNIIGWNEEREFKVEIKNTRNIPVKVEIKRNFNTSYWDIRNAGNYGKFKKVDSDTVKYTLTISPNSTQEFSYMLTTKHGRNQG